MKKTLLALVAAAFLSVVPSGYAQNNQEDQSNHQQQRDREAGSVTIRGCLAKASQPQQYMVTDETSGESVSFGGSARLDDYVNQTVEITGQYANDGGQKTFQPQSLKAVSRSCKGSGQGKQ